MNDRSLSPARTALPAWFGALVVLALWMLARPYVGLRHDGAVYLAQALRHLFPDVMASDLFFAYGSQDSFTVFGRLLAELYRRWDIAAGQVAVLAVCQVTLLLALLQLLKPLASPLERWLALAAVAVMSHVYGGFGVMSFSERFVTARSPAEPLALLALVLLLQRRLLSAVLVFALAAAVHPLMTLPLVVVAWLYLCRQDRRWRWAALAALLPVLLALAGVKPFDALLQRYDADWWRPVSSANALTLVLAWEAVDWQLTLFDLGLLALAARTLAAPLPQLLRATLWASAGLLAQSAVGADLLHNVLITQLQLWRVLWFVHLLALALLPALVLRAWRQPGGGRLLALALAAAAVAVNGRWPAGWAFMAWAVAAWWMTLARPALSPLLARAMLAFTALALLGLSAGVADENMALLKTSMPVFDLNTWLLLGATLPVLSLPLAGGLFVAWQRGGVLRWAALGLLAGAAAYGASQWDRRSVWTTFIETGLHREHPFSALVPRNAQVYWNDTPAATWVLLKRASYFSLEQGAGALFNRQNALEVERRQRLFEPLDMQKRLCEMTSLLDVPVPGSEPSCTPTLPVLERLCRSPQGPDFMVFERKLPRGVVASWTFEVPDLPPRHFYLYDCLQLR